MNKLRKTGVLLLIFTLVLGMAIPALADTGSITVENPVQGQSYTAYQIFDVTYNADRTSYAYTISKSSVWLASIESYDGITLTEPADETQDGIYVVTATGDFSAASFANHLKGSIPESADGTELSMEGGKATASGLPLGYYFVSSTSGALCNLTTTDPTATIYDKNDIPFDKVDDQTDVDVGQTVNYTLTGKVPSTTGFETYTYQFADTMSEGLTFQNDIKVYVGDTQLTSEYYTYHLNETGDGFTLSLDVKALQSYVMQEIKVTYSAVVNEKAIASIENNSATLKYSSNPITGEETTTEPVETEVFSSKLVIDKFAGSGEDKVSLAGAKFVLKNEDGYFYQYTAPVTDDPSTEADETKAAKVNWVENQKDATEIVTDENGAAAFGGLANGTYYLIETEAPEGYNLLSEPQQVSIASDGTDETALTQITSVENNFGTELPETGGAGTTLFYLVGGALVAGAFIVLVTRRRMKTEK